MSAYGGKLRFVKAGKANETTFPFDLVIDEGADSTFPSGTSFPLFYDEATALRDQLNELLDPKETRVRVEILFSKVTGGQLYTYTDPSGSLEVDDLVRIPFGPTTKVGIVRELGGEYFGEVKDVQGRFTLEAF